MSVQYGEGKIPARVLGRASGVPLLGLPRLIVVWDDNRLRALRSVQYFPGVHRGQGHYQTH
jgi:hypothetical protein